VSGDYSSKALDRISKTNKIDEHLFITFTVQGKLWMKKSDINKQLSYYG
jgi:hypothetical protein